MPDCCHSRTSRIRPERGLSVQENTIAVTKTCTRKLAKTLPYLIGVRRYVRFPMDEKHENLPGQRVLETEGRSGAC